MVLNPINEKKTHTFEIEVFYFYFIVCIYLNKFSKFIAYQKEMVYHTYITFYCSISSIWFLQSYVNFELKLITLFKMNTKN